MARHVRDRVKARGFTLIELLVVVAIIALLISILLPSLGRAKELANRVHCSANLRGIGQSLVLFGYDNSDKYPLVPNGNAPTKYQNSWATTPTTYTGTQVDNAIASASTNHQGSPSACLWIMTLQGQAPPKMFICKSDRSVSGPSTRVSSSGYFFDNVQAQDQFSYSIVYPWVSQQGNSRAWQAKMESSVPQMADMAPYNDGKYKDLTAPRGSKLLNSANHEDKGQNVAFGDGHVEFQKDPFCGDTQDNIWSAGAVGQTQGYVQSDGTMPTIAGTGDCVMVPVRSSVDGIVQPKYP